MKQLLLSLTLLMSTFSLTAQTYEIGHTTITFSDPNRTGGFGSGGGPGRQIQSEIYYPSDIAGNDVDPSNGEHPVIIFGHGFAMVWDAYANIWETLVPQGYILVFPRTEGGLSPSHSEFGEDLRIIAQAMQLEGYDNGSLFFTHVSDRTAIMGHSMGGGASMLAGENNTDIATIIGLAPAETNPSAEQAAANVSVPTLILSADEDAVTPPVDHHLPIYNNLGASCNYFINIIGGAHCYYANTNFNCDFGESASGGSISISRSEQQNIMFRYIIPWLDLYLNGTCGNASVFESDLANDADVTFQSSCASSLPTIDNTLTENAGTLTANESNAQYQWLDCNSGYSMIVNETNQTYTPLSTGDYAVEISGDVCVDTSSCYSISTSGITFQENVQIEVYPNPTNNVFNVKTPIPGKYRMTNALGERLQSGTLKSGSNTIPIYVSAGTYLLEVAIGNKKIIERLVVK